MSIFKYSNTMKRSTVLHLAILSVLVYMMPGSIAKRKRENPDRVGSDSLNGTRNAYNVAKSRCEKLAKSWFNIGKIAQCVDNVVNKVPQIQKRGNVYANACNFASLAA